MCPRLTHAPSPPFTSSLPWHMIHVIQNATNTTLKDYHYGGAGGAILRGSFLRWLGRSGHWRSDIEQLTAGLGAIMSDQLLTSLFLMNGGSIGSWPGYVEYWRSDYSERLKAGTIEVSHQDKSMYGDRK